LIEEKEYIVNRVLLKKIINQSKYWLYHIIQNQNIVNAPLFKQKWIQIGSI